MASVPAVTDAGPSALASRATPAGGRILHFILFLMLTLSFFTFIEPSPYEFLFLLLLVACVGARMSVDFKLIPLIFLLLVMHVFGFMSLLPVVHERDAIQFMVISTYLAVSAFVFACLFTQDSMKRIAIVRAGYTISAVIASLLGIIGYFELFNGAEQLFTLYGRAVATFKHPNVYGSFLVLPMLFVVERFVSGQASVRYAVAGCIILTGLLLSFSRAAWGNFAISAFVMFILLLLTSVDGQMRARLVKYAAVAITLFIVLLLALLSVEDVRTMFEQRFRLFQDYDTGTSHSRFSLQAAAIEEVLRHPNGMGPWVFGKKYGFYPHNSYLGAMLNHGWIGGTAYITVMLATLTVGFRACFVRAPWQRILILSVAAFFGLSLYTFVAETEHYRHAFLMMGMVWGLSVASLNMLRETNRRSLASPVHPPLSQRNLRPNPGGGAFFRLRL